MYRSGSQRRVNVMGKAALQWCSRSSRGVHPPHRAPHARSARGEFKFRAKSRPSPPARPTPRQSRQLPRAEWVGCVTQSCDEVKAWVRSNMGVQQLLLCSGKGFNESVYQEMLAALRPLTFSPPLNTVMILPDCGNEIMREMFAWFKVVSKEGGILQVRVLFPGVIR